MVGLMLWVQQRRGDRQCALSTGQERQASPRAHSLRAPLDTHACQQSDQIVRKDLRLC